MIVAAELIGEAIVISIADRLGLCRTLFSALLVSAATYAALGLVGSRVALALVTIGALFVAFEVTVVVLLAFASTVARRSRSQVHLLGRLMAAVACGNAVGASIAPLVTST